MLKHYPAEILRLTERIVGYERDIAWAAQQPQPQKDVFVGMVIGDKQYLDKKEAGSAILAACQAMSNPDPVPLGEYRGFPMELSFDTFCKEYRITLKGQLTHFTNLGTDIYGNFTRLDNVIEAFPNKLEACKATLENTKTQLESAKAELDKPFPQETELAEKSKRLSEVNIALNLDKRENEVIADAPDEGDSVGQPQRKDRGRER